MIPWEGKHLFAVVKKAAAEMPKGEPVTLEVRVSEGPEERVKIKARLIDMLRSAGADPAKLDVKVLCSYKSGYSWLIDDIEPQLKGAGVAEDQDRVRAVSRSGPSSRPCARSIGWNQELFPGR